jgi:predicted ATP-dependent serine protease
MSQHPALLGRDSELDDLNRVLSEAASGEGGALVIRGTAGIGKSALLESAVAELEGFRVVKVSGTESEAEVVADAPSFKTRPSSLGMRLENLGLSVKHYVRDSLKYDMRYQALETQTFRAILQNREVESYYTRVS